MSEEQIPTPDKAGVIDTQTRSNSDLELVEAKKPLEGLDMAQAITGLAASYPKSLGGNVSSALIAVITQQLESDKQELKISLKECSKKYEEERNATEQIKIENAVLKNIINTDRQSKHLRNFAITFGMGLIGTGIFLSRSQLDNYAVGAYGLGFILVLFGWLSGPKEVK